MTDREMTRARRIAAGFIHEYRRTAGGTTRGAEVLIDAAAGLTRLTVDLGLRGEHADALIYATAAELLTERALRLTHLTPKEYPAMHNTLTISASGATLDADESTRWIEKTFTKIKSMPEAGASPALAGRHLGMLVYRASTKSWELAKSDTWTSDDYRALAKTLPAHLELPPRRADDTWIEVRTPDGSAYVTKIFRRDVDVMMRDLFDIDLPRPDTGVGAPYIDPIEVGGSGCTVTQDDVDLMFDCHDEAQFEGEAEIADDPRPVEIFRCPKTNRIMRRIGVSRYDETTGKFLAVAFEGATGLDQARIWCAPAWVLQDVPSLAPEVLAATTIHTREDGTRYADVSIARPLDDCNAEELAGIAHDLFELITNPDATAEGEWGENRVFLEVTA